MTKSQPFLWKTAESIYMEPRSMTTTHVFHSLRMLWNHVLPDYGGDHKAIYHLRPFDVRSGVYSWAAHYKRDAFNAFLAELGKPTRRAELTDGQLADLAHITLHVNQFWKEIREEEQADLDASFDDWEPPGEWQGADQVADMGHSRPITLGYGNEGDDDLPPGISLGM